jgi:hypothetical protein
MVHHQFIEVFGNVVKSMKAQQIMDWGMLYGMILDESIVMEEPSFVRVDCTVVTRMSPSPIVMLFKLWVNPLSVR